VFRELNFLILRIRLLASEVPERQLSVGVVSKFTFLGSVFKVYFFLAFLFPYFHIGSRYFGSMRPPVGRGRSVIVSITEVFSFQSSIWHAILKDVHIFWRIWSHKIYPVINRSSSANVGGSARCSVATRILQLLIRGAQIGSSGFFLQTRKGGVPKSDEEKRAAERGTATVSFFCCTASVCDRICSSTHYTT